MRSLSGRWFQFHKHKQKSLHIPEDTDSVRNWEALKTPEILITERQSA